MQKLIFHACKYEAFETISYHNYARINSINVASIFCAIDTSYHLILSFQIKGLKTTLSEWMFWTTSARQQKMLSKF